MDLTAKIENGKLIISIPINSPPQRSATGKTMVLASTHGNHALTGEDGAPLLYEGKVVTFGANAYFKP